jgi:hypothetical protein
MGTSFPSIVSHQVTKTFFPDVPISALSELTVELLRLILSPKVFPPSEEKESYRSVVSRYLGSLLLEV